MLDSSLRKLGGVHRTFHQIAGPEDENALEAALGNNRRDFLGDMQPRQWRSVTQEVDGFMHRRTPPAISWCWC